jgi:hypothetical protein
MTYDPFQSNAALGAYAGAGSPFYSPLTAMQTSAINPYAINPYAVNPSLVNQAVPWNPLNGYQGIPQSIQPQWMGYGQPTPWQNPLQFAGLQQGGLQNGITHNAYAQQLAAQQLAAQQLAQHIVAQQQAAQQLAALGQQNGGFGQNISPFGQTGFSQMAPQSWVGQQAGQGGGPAHALLLAHLTARALQGQGFNPGLTQGASFPV